MTHWTSVIESMCEQWCKATAIVDATRLLYRTAAGGGTTETVGPPAR